MLPKLNVVRKDKTSKLVYPGVILIQRDFIQTHGLGFLLVGWFGFGAFNHTVDSCLCFTNIIREPEFGSVSGVRVGLAMGPFFS